MISQRFPRWPDRDAVPPGRTFAYTVAEESLGHAIKTSVNQDGDIPVSFIGDTPAIWPDEIVPDPKPLPWWANAAVWGCAVATGAAGVVLLASLVMTWF